MRAGVTEDQVRLVEVRLQDLGYTTTPIMGVEKTIVAGVGGQEHTKVDALDQLRSCEGVEDVMILTKAYKLTSREYQPETTVIDLGDGVTIGGTEIALMAGPCTVESEEQVMTTADSVARAGAKILRGGAYKPSTSPYSFQGMGEEGLRLLRAAADANGLKVVTEVMDPRKVDLVGEYADILQIGTRNMQNYDLLREVGRSPRAVMLKRGMSAKIEEWLLAAEYVMTHGNARVMLCERGIRTFETAMRNTLDLAAVPVVKAMSHLPVVVDPSQGTGRRDLVGALSRGAIAVGADGLIIEVHPNPDKAIKDGAQSVTLTQFDQMVNDLQAMASAVGRTVA